MAAQGSAASLKPKKQSFQATIVWNDLVAGFRANIELKKYRRNYFTPTYDQCFTSIDAINCMILVLKSHPNFETRQIEKHQAIRLLEKFYESKVFTDVIKTERRKTFQAENGIYQLLSKSDENVFQSVVTTTNRTNNNESQIHSSIEPNSSAIFDSWKQYFLERLEKYLLKIRNRHGGYLLHQIEQEMKSLDANQFVENLQTNLYADPLSIAGQLVDWLPESMSIVIDYPTSLEGRNLPDYPSFIFDLFDMVIDTFDMQRQYLSSSMNIFNLILQLIVNKGNHLFIESLHDRDDHRAVNCFPSELYASRSTGNPYQHYKVRSNHFKSSTRPARLDVHDYKKLYHDDEKSFAFTNLRRKSLSSCDLFHLTSKTLSSPFDEIHNWLNNKHPTTNNISSQDKITNDEFELIQLALIHLSPTNRQYLYIILYFLSKSIRNPHFCPNDSVKLRIQRSFAKLIVLNHDDTLASTHVFDCFIEHYVKLFDISLETRKIVARRLTKSKKENKPVGLPSTANKKSGEDRHLRQTLKQLRVSRPLTYNEHLDSDVRPLASTTFVRKAFLPSPATTTTTNSNEKTRLTAASCSPRRRARSFEPRAHTTTLFDKTINPFQKLRVILKRNE